ncbi:MAG: FAD-binding oxidoreductase [Phycisphaerales bacterium]|nr:FAD-binding oxidoreductase [Phycisphaerales bacterium]
MSRQTHPAASDVRLNDVHSRLNPADVHLYAPTTLDDVAAIVGAAAQRGTPVAVCGGRHAMGGQQFANGGALIDMTQCDRLLELDMERGLVRVESGIQWRALIQGVLETQRRHAPDQPPRWGIAQKQTGADALSIGGALAANVHGRGLLMAPFVSDVESFTLVIADGQTRRCSRDENSELFSLAIGGYGLFGVIGEVTIAERGV